MSSLTIAAVAH